LPKTNTSANVQRNNDTQTQYPSNIPDTNIIEPKKDDKGKLHCPLCDGIYNSREDYVSHALTQHQPTILNCDKKGCTSK
jgi:uncharacterized C2H2 Zn-finger protein